MGTVRKNKTVAKTNYRVNGSPGTAGVKMNLVSCELCGTKIDKRGLHAHKNGAACIVGQAARYAKENNLIRCGNYAKALQSVVPVERLATGYQPGYIGKCTKINYSPFAPKWAVDSYAALREAGIPVAEAKELLKNGPEDPKLRATLALGVLKK